MNKYLKFEYWNTCDLGNIYYQGGQHFIFYLDADVGEPLHEEVEEGQENGDGDFIPTYRRQMKRYRIRTGLVPDYLIDAIQRMKLHDNIELTFKSGEVEQIYNVDVEPEWQFEKYAWQGTMTLTFDMDESITISACCDNLTVGTEPAPPGPVDLGGYYVATTGSDVTGDGSFLNPWGTWNFGFNQLVAGDTLYIRGGTYSPTGTYLLSGYRGVAVNNIDGTAVNPIIVSNYPNEVPILDGTNITDVNNRTGVYIANSDYWQLSGLTVQNVVQYHNIAEPWYGSGGFGFVLSDHIVVTNCVAHHIGGSGFYALDAFTNIALVNCDAYACDDPYSSDVYGGADGFAFTSNQSAGTVTFTGCRAWHCSDDGFDVYGTRGLVTWNKCWAFNNGYAYGTTTPTGDGNGIKLGNTPDYSTILKRVVTNCLTFGNAYTGILQNAAQCIIHLYNNTVYNNYKGIEIYSFALVHQIKNNVSFGNTANYSDDGGSSIANAIITNNSYDADWQPAGPMATSADFKSVTAALASAARQADGSLPIIDLLHLTTGSDLIYAGTYVGLTNDGDGESYHVPPSIGAFEY